MKHGAVLLLAFLVAGCATAGKFNKRMDTWLGRDVNAFITQWGAYADQRQLPNGNVQYIWYWTGTPVTTVARGESVVSALTRTPTCNIYVTTRAQAITAWSAQGSGCKSR